jgi:hypothetical protein
MYFYFCNICKFELWSCEIEVKLLCHCGLLADHKEE